jgi:shikimate kinase
MDRASRDAAVRPLLTSPDPLARITELMQKRETAYVHFTQVETTGKTPDEVVGILLARIFHET